MKRMIFQVATGHRVCGCCPGHDKWPEDAYKNRRSKRARSLGIAREHRYARRIVRYRLKRYIKEG